MNRNSIINLSNIIAQETNSDIIRNFASEILTESEIETLSKRWRIMEMLADGHSQREISRTLNVSLCKVTRGSQILKKKNSITAMYLKKEKEIKNE